jgi:Epoxide hydrolase N terminus
MCVQAAAATGVRPFTVEVAQEELEELRRRIQATRWPQAETVADQAQGVRLATMQELARYRARDLHERASGRVQGAALSGMHPQRKIVFHG